MKTLSSVAVDNGNGGSCGNPGNPGKPGNGGKDGQFGSDGNGGKDGSGGNVGNGAGDATVSSGVGWPTTAELPMANKPIITKTKSFIIVPRNLWITINLNLNLIENYGKFHKLFHYLLHTTLRMWNCVLNLINNDNNNK